MRRIGVLGGTFDPVHVGHLVTAVNVRHALALDVVLLVVAGSPWQKEGTREITPAEDRLAVVRAAVGDVEGVEASDLEVRRGGASYTADTLAALRSAEPDAVLFVILGADAAAGLHTWERVEEVRRDCRLVVVDRPGTPHTELVGWDEIRVEVPALEVSSTDLRARVADGRPLDYLVPEAAMREIRARGLYGGAQMPQPSDASPGRR